MYIHRRQTLNNVKCCNSDASQHKSTQPYQSNPGEYGLRMAFVL